MTADEMMDKLTNMACLIIANELRLSTPIEIYTRDRAMMGRIYDAVMNDINLYITEDVIRTTSLDDTHILLEAPKFPYGTCITINLPLCVEHAVKEALNSQGTLPGISVM